jgi:hypothetical protein
MNLAPLEDKAPPSRIFSAAASLFPALPFYPVVPEILEISSQSRAPSSFSLPPFVLLSPPGLGKIRRAESAPSSRH